MDDVADTANTLEKIDDIGDGLKGMDELEDVFHYVDEVDNIPDPPNTVRDPNGVLRNKNGTFAKDPKAKGRTKKPRYQRSMKERKKALLRDKDKLDPKAKEYIEKHNGKKVPNKQNKDYDGDIDYEVHHKKPLELRDTPEGKADLDIAENMETIPTDKHIDLHRVCGDAYHAVKNSKKN